MTEHTTKRPVEGTGRLSEPSAARTGTAEGTSQSQLDLVLRLLLENESVCSSEFYRRYIPRFGARIWELRRAGYVIYRTKCEDPTHLHRNRAYAYELVALPYPPREVAR